MKSNKIFFIAFAVALCLSGCQDYNQLVQNPNLPTKSSPSLLFTGILNSMNDANAWNGFQGSMCASQFWISSYTYYGTNNYDQGPFLNTSFGYYSTLENVVRMETEAKNAGAATVNPYSALASFFKAYYFNLMSQKFGDLPLSQALQGSSNKAPVYDSQKSVYIQILAWLDDSNSQLSQLIGNNDQTLAGDIFLGNDLTKWQKLVNAFTLRVLVSLSNQSSDADIAVATKFANIINNPSKYPLMTSSSNNLQYVFNAQFNNYPKNPGNRGQTVAREVVSATFLNLTTSLNDPRTFIAATPAPALLAAGKSFSDYAAYAGGSPGDDMSTLGTNSQAGKYSYVNALRYYSTIDGSKAEPAIIIGYPEMCFNIAEGINRGWVSGNAGAWYSNGITASMNFLGITEGGSISVGDITLNTYGTVTTSISNYLAQPSVVYQGNTTAGLNQILTQKYIAFWQNSNWEAFFNQRRTGVPTFLTGAGTGNGGKVPVRWQYPIAEQSANTSNYSSAVQSQYSGTDDLNGTMWILK
jgi:hypothetical protein